MGYQVYISEESEQSIQRIAQINGYGYHLNSVYICCASMMVERMLDLSFPPEMCAQFALRCGVTEEADFLLLAGAIAARWARIKGPAFDAAAGAVWLHGAASDALVGNFGDPSLVGTAAAIGSLRVRLETGAGKQNKETDNDGNNKL